MRQHGGGVPRDFDDFVQRYERFVLWTIHRVSRGRVHAEDVPDLLQKVYLRVWEKNVLETCRRVIEARGTGQFSTYLYFVVRSVLVNDFRANARDPLNHAYRLLDPREANTRQRVRRPREVSGEHVPALAATFRDPDFEQRLLADLAIDQFAQFIETTRRGARLARTLQLLCEGCTTPEITARTGLSRSNVKQARRDLRTEYAAYRRAG